MELEIRENLEAKRYREAFDMIIDRFQHKVFRLAFAMVHDEALAEDTAQEVFLKVWKALSRYTGEASLSTWIYTITRNASLDAIKKRAVRKAVSLDSLKGEPGPPVGKSGDAPFDRVMEGDVRRLVGKLPAKYRHVLTLFYLEEKSYEEVSRLLDRPMGTVKTYLHRAKKELARIVEKDRKRSEWKMRSNHGMSLV